jgi:nitrate/nitrite transporter NarK
MRYILLSFLCAATVIAYVQRSAMNGATKAIEDDVHISSENLGLVMGGWYLLYSLFQLPAGWTADRLGSKLALVLFALVWSILTGLAGLAGGPLGLFLLWGLMGAAQAGIFPCCTKAIGATFPKTQQAFASGALACCMSLGAAMAPMITGHLLDQLTWRHIFALYAVPGLVWAVLFWLIVRRPDQPAPPPEAEDPADQWHALPPESKTEARIQWVKLVTDGQMLLLCFQQFLRAGAMVFFYTWFARFLQETKGLSTRDAGTLAFWPPFIGAFGGLFGGLVSDLLLWLTGNARLARQGLTFVVLVGCTSVAAAAYLVADPHLAVLLISIGTFCGMASGVSAYALAMTYGGKHVATVFATMNMSGNLGATVFPIAVAWIVTATGNWNYALLLFVSLFGIAAVCWVVLNPKGTLFDAPETPHDHTS